MKSIFRNKGRLMAMAAMLLALAMLWQGTALAAPVVGDTTASVSFIDGDLELGGDATGSGLNFDFGQHTIPVAGISYPSENAVPHILQVEDSRFASGDWHVTVGLSAFTDVNSTATPFDAIISLQNAVASNENASAGTAGLSVENDISVASGMGPTLVMAADDTLLRGIFNAQWNASDVALNIDDSEVVNIGLANYTATLTWTLNLGPM